jgi:hypothetical protein
MCPKGLEKAGQEEHAPRYTALCNDVGAGDLAPLNGTLDDVAYLPA